MKAVCPLHGPTTIIGTNAYGFPLLVGITFTPSMREEK